MMMRISAKPRAAPAVAGSRRAVAARATKYDEELIKTAVRCLYLRGCCGRCAQVGA